MLHHALVAVVRRVGAMSPSGQREAQWIKHLLQAITSTELGNGNEGLSRKQIDDGLAYLERVQYWDSPSGSHLVEVMHQQKADLLNNFEDHRYQDKSRASQLHWLGEHLGAIEPMLKAWHCLCTYRATIGSGLFNLTREKFYPEFSDVQRRHVMTKMQAIHALLAHLHSTTPQNVQLLLKGSKSSPTKPKRSPK